MGFNWQSGGDCRIGGSVGRTDALQRSQTPAVVFPLQKVRCPCGGSQGGTGIGDAGEPSFTLDTGPEHGVAVTPFDTTQMTSALNRSQPKAGDPCHPLAAGAHPPAVAFSCKDHGADAGELAPTLRAMEHDGSHANGGGQVAVAFQESQSGCREYGEAGSLRAHGPGHDPVGTRVREGSMVRRLTPTECERLQGFPDGWTAITYRGKPAADGPRYRALGNSIAVPCLAWIGRRLEIVDAALRG